jgi:hypothetical protein
MTTKLLALTLGGASAALLGDTHLPLSFGIELELRFPGSEAWTTSSDRLLEALNKTGVPATFATKEQNVTGHVWKLEQDASIPGSGFEMVSPIDPPLEHLQNVWRTVMDAHAFVDPITDFHVHVDVSNKTVGEVRNVYKNFVFAETALDMLHPFHHRGNVNEWLQSLSSNFDSRAEAELDACDTYLCLRNAMQGRKTNEFYEMRRYKLNLIIGEEDGLPSNFEFRGHHSTLDVEAALDWIYLTNVFVARSCDGLLLSKDEREEEEMYGELFDMLLQDKDLEKRYNVRRQLQQQQESVMSGADRVMLNATSHCSHSGSRLLTLLFLSHSGSLLIY